MRNKILKPKQQVRITVQVTTWLDMQWSERKIHSYVTKGILKGFADQLNYFEPENMIDIIEIREEAEIYRE